MRFTEFDTLLEDARSVTQDELEGMKAVIASKIKELPSDDATAKALREIEELLQHVNAGGRMGMIYDQLEQINDPAVMAAQKMLARYILSIEATPEERKEFFTLWRANKMVNVSALLSKKTVAFATIFNKYESNPLIREFVDDMMEVSTLGHGRGEFGLNVLSKSIWKPEDNKGDLQMKYEGRTWQIECKTTMGGAARFSDQEIRPAEGYEAAAIALNDFARKNKSYPVKVPASGISINKAIEILQNSKPADQSKFLDLIKNCVTLIFGGKAGSQKDIKQIISFIKNGDSGNAHQAWSTASFNYYINKKHDDGVLYIDLNQKSAVFYDSAEDLTNQGLRFHASTPYLSAVKDPGRNAYPQIEVVPTSFGGKTAQKTIPKYKAKSDQQEIFNKMTEWAKTLANRRGVKDAKTINSMAKVAYDAITRKVPSATIIGMLENMFPQLVANIPQQSTMVSRAAAQPAKPTRKSGISQGINQKPAVPASAQPAPIPGQPV